MYTRQRERWDSTPPPTLERRPALKASGGAIQVLKVERIGHGTRAAEDEALVQYLAESRLPIEMCPLSNVATRVVESIDKHPVRDYFDRGLMVTINTDDPVMFGNSMAQEF